MEKILKSKLSPRAYELLTLISDRTQKEGNEIKSFFYPGATLSWHFSKTLNRSLLIYGSGDAAVLRSLERKGLIEAYKPDVYKYSYSITSKGSDILKETSRA